MSEKDTIEALFQRLQGSFDIEEPLSGHKQRFLKKMETQKSLKKPISWRKPLSIAASVILLIGIGFFSLVKKESNTGLASVSSEMEKTQSFFTTTINQEIETLKSFQDEDTKHLVQDALKRLEFLEKDYEKLKIDLLQSGNDKRVVAAMIANFQNRIEILEKVFSTMEEVKTLKANNNETTI